VRSFFVVGGSDGDAAVLRRIHDRVIREAAEISESGLAGKRGRGRRRHAIIASICAGEPAPDTAARLGTSVHHYYRERHAICTLIARTLSEAARTPGTLAGVADPVRLLLTRATLLCDQGFAGRAIGILESALANLPEGTSKLAVRSELARAMICFGDTDRAEALLAESCGAEELQRSEDAVDRWTHDHLALTRVHLAIETGTDPAVGSKLERLARSKISRHLYDEEALEAIIACGDWYCQMGAFGQGRKMLDYARRLSRRAPHVPARLEPALLLLAAHCAQERRDEFDLEYSHLSEAYALSMSNGSVCGVLAATAGLTQYYLPIGNDDAVYRLALEGFEIAQAAEGTRLLEQFVIQTAGTLLRTRYWQAVGTFVNNVEGLVRRGSLSWAHLKEFQGRFFTRTKQYDLAASVLTEAYEEARKINHPWLEGVALRDLAIVQHQSGSEDGGIEYMKEALPLLERSSGVVSLGATYDAAMRILPGRRVARRAEQIKAGLVARARKLQERSSGVAVGECRDSLASGR